MDYFEKLAEGLDVREAVRQLDARPELWDALPLRTQNETFRGTSDIWLRFRPLCELTSPARFAEPHFAEFYPAWKSLPALRGIVFRLMARVEATELGGILITRIPPGGAVRPHHDRGGWHAKFYSRKVYVPLRTNSRCVNHCEDESVVMAEGEAWWFDNLVTHSVVNDGDSERITLIVCMRAEA